MQIILTLKCNKIKNVKNNYKFNKVKSRKSCFFNYKLLIELTKNREIRIRRIDNLEEKMLKIKIKFYQPSTEK